MIGRSNGATSLRKLRVQGSYGGLRTKLTWKALSGNDVHLGVSASATVDGFGQHLAAMLQLQYLHCVEERPGARFEFDLPCSWSKRPSMQAWNFTITLHPAR